MASIQAVVNGLKWLRPDQSDMGSVIWSLLDWREWVEYDRCFIDEVTLVSLLDKDGVQDEVREISGQVDLI